MKNYKQLKYMFLERNRNIKVNIIRLAVFMLALIAVLLVNTKGILAKEAKDGSAAQIQNIMEDQVVILDKKISVREANKKAVARERARKAEKKRNDLVTYARQFIGNPYVLGGRSLTKGCDCASFVTLVYKNYGYNWTFGSVSTLLSNCGGQEVSVNNLREGDIIFFGDLAHVAIYSGNGKIVHAMDEYNGITETVLFPYGNGYTYSGKKIYTVRRILQ